jgi:hypothetical protein
LPTSLAAGSAPIASPKKPTSKPSEKPQSTTVEDWHKRALTGLNDQTKDVPKAW